MKLEGEQTLLRVYVRNTDNHGWSAASDVLVERAKTRGLAGATVLRGIFGLDVAGQLLESARWSLVEHVPETYLSSGPSRRVTPGAKRFLAHGVLTRRACARLVAEANALGGKDNITVLVACFEATAASASTKGDQS